MSMYGPFRVTTVTDLATGRRSLRPPAGVSAWDLRSGRYRRLLRGVYVHASVAVTPLILAEAGLLVAGEGGVVSHRTAARVWGASVPDDGLVHVTCSGRPRGSGMKAHRPKPGQRGASVRGVAVTTPSTTFVDLSDEPCLVDLVVLGDSLVRAGHVTPESLVAAASGYRNHKIFWPDGRVRFRFDLSFPDVGLVIEYDGRQHAESDEQWGHDIDRRAWMDGHHLRLVVVRSRDIYRTPARTLARIAGTMRARGMLVPGSRTSGAGTSRACRATWPSRRDHRCAPHVLLSRAGGRLSRNKPPRGGCWRCSGSEGLGGAIPAGSRSK